MARTTCTVYCRGGKTVPRIIGVKGKQGMIDEAWAMALDFIEQNGDEGGRAELDEQAARQRVQQEPICGGTREKLPIRLVLPWTPSS